MKKLEKNDANLYENSIEKQSSNNLKEYSWIEIVKHDKPGDCWVVIHGKVYDLSNFVKIHPGYFKLF